MARFFVGVWVVWVGSVQSKVPSPSHMNRRGLAERFFLGGACDCFFAAFSLPFH